MVVEVLTTLFKKGLDRNGPWVLFQQRKKYAPWISAATMDLIKQRNGLKKTAVDLMSSRNDASEAWVRF